MPSPFSMARHLSTLWSDNSSGFVLLEHSACQLTWRIWIFSNNIKLQKPKTSGIFFGYQERVKTTITKFLTLEFCTQFQHRGQQVTTYTYSGIYLSVSQFNFKANQRLSMFHSTQSCPMLWILRKIFACYTSSTWIKFQTTFFPQWSLFCALFHNRELWSVHGWAACCHVRWRWTYHPAGKLGGIWCRENNSPSTNLFLSGKNFLDWKFFFEK